HAAQANWRERKRQRNRRTEDRGGKVTTRDVDQDALAQLDPLEIGAVRPQRLLAIRAGLGVVEEHPWDPAAGPLSQVLDTGHCAHGSQDTGSGLAVAAGATVRAGRTIVVPDCSGL